MYFPTVDNNNSNHYVRWFEQVFLNITWTTHYYFWKLLFNWRANKLKFIKEYRNYKTPVADVIEGENWLLNRIFRILQMSKFVNCKKWRIEC